MCLNLFSFFLIYTILEVINGMPIPAPCIKDPLVIRNDSHLIKSVKSNTENQPSSVIINEKDLFKTQTYSEGDPEEMYSSEISESGTKINDEFDNNYEQLISFEGSQLNNQDGIENLEESNTNFISQTNEETFFDNLNKVDDTLNGFRDVNFKTIQHNKEINNDLIKTNEYKYRPTQYFGSIVQVQPQYLQLPTVVMNVPNSDSHIYQNKKYPVGLAQENYHTIQNYQSGLKDHIPEYYKYQLQLSPYNSLCKDSIQTDETYVCQEPPDIQTYDHVLYNPYLINTNYLNPIIWNYDTSSYNLDYLKYLSDTLSECNFCDNYEHLATLAKHFQGRSILDDLEPIDSQVTFSLYKIFHNLVNVHLKNVIEGNDDLEHGYLDI